MEMTVLPDLTEVIVSSYFTLAGQFIRPYMVVTNDGVSFDPVLLNGQQQASFRFEMTT